MKLCQGEVHSSSEEIQKCYTTVMQCYTFLCGGRCLTLFQGTFKSVTPLWYSVTVFWRKGRCLRLCQRVVCKSSKKIQMCNTTVLQCYTLLRGGWCLKLCQRVVNNCSEDTWKCNTIVIQCNTSLCWGRWLTLCEEAISHHNIVIKKCFSAVIHCNTF